MSAVRIILPTRGHRVTRRLLADLRAAARRDGAAEVYVRPHANHLTTAAVTVLYSPRGPFRPNYRYIVETATGPTRRGTTSAAALDVLSNGSPCNYADPSTLICINHTCAALHRTRRRMDSELLVAAQGVPESVRAA